MAYEQYGGILIKNLHGLLQTNFVASAVSGNRKWSFSWVALCSKFMDLG